MVEDRNEITTKMEKIEEIIILIKNIFLCSRFHWYILERNNE